MFFKTRPPLEPVSFVRKICEDAASSSGRKQSRFVKRLTPMTLMGKATWESMDEVAQQVLAPHFHQPNGLPKKVSWLWHSLKSFIRGCLRLIFLYLASNVIAR